MKLRAWVLAGFGFCWLLAGIALLRTVTNLDALVQAWLFVLLGAILFIMGVIFCVLLRDEDLDDWADDIPSSALWSIGFFGILACLTGLYWTTSKTSAWSTYAALPLLSYEEVSRQPPGKLVRVEGMAHNERTLEGGDGSALALQLVEFSHNAGGRHRETVIDYAAVAPRIIVLQKQTDSATASTLAVKTTVLDKDFSFLAKAHLSLDGSSRETKQQIEKLISPVFDNYKYSSSGYPVLDVWSLPQDSVVTVCGTTAKEPGSGRITIEARSIATLTDDRFLAMVGQVASETRKVGIVWWSVGGLLLIMVGLVLWGSRDA